MKLEYHKGANFGDALNPIIFNYFLPNYFDEDNSVIVLGIGSILGLIKPNSFQRAIVFSSGFANGAKSTYGSLPKINNRYDIICVRGPLTAKLLKLDKKKSATDGAILLAAMPWKDITKKWNYSFIPHVGSLDFFDWEDLCKRSDINFIDPRKAPFNVINEIRASKNIIAEAMHGAIAADTFRIPWIPVKAYSTINEFKWKDWLYSLEMEYQPNILPSLFNTSISLQILKNKIPYCPIYILKGINWIFQIFQRNFKERKAEKSFKKLKKQTFFLSGNTIFNLRLSQMLKHIKTLKDL